MSGRRLSRRDFLRMSALATAGGLLMSCGGGGGATEPPAEEPAPDEAPAEEVPAEERITLQWWSGWGGTTSVAAQTAVQEAFNASGASCDVEYVSTTEMNDKLLTAVAGGTPPDLGVCCVEYASYYARDAFMPIDSFIDASDVINKDEFVPGLFESMTWQGKTYGVPAFECGPRYGLIVNRALAEEADLDPDSLPETWDEMMVWHEAMTQFDDAGNVNVVGYDPRDATAGAGPATNVQMFWAISYGFPVWDEDTMEFNFDNEDMVAALETMKAFYDFVGVEKMAAFRDSFGGWTQSPSSSFPSSVQGALVTGYYAPGELAGSGPDIELAVGWPPVPEGRRGTKVQMVGGHPIYIPVGSPHPDQAFEFIEFVTQDETAEIMFENTGWLPGRTAFYDPNSDRFDVYAGLRWYIESVNEATEFWPGFIIPIQGFVNQQRSQMYEAVIYGEKTPEQAAADIQQICTEELRNQFPEMVG